MRFFLFLIILTASAMMVDGQQLQFRHLGTNEGLSSDLRLVITEDRQGRLWIGSDEGINIFDGYQLTTLAQRDNIGITSNSIQRIFCDSKGSIWIATPAGLFYKEEQQSRFHQLISNDTLFNDFPVIGEGQGDVVYVIAKRKLFVIDSAKNIREIPALSPILEKYRNPLCFVQFSNEEWLIGFRQRLVLVDLKNHTIINELNYRDAWCVNKINDSMVLAGSFVHDTLALINVRNNWIEPINHWPTNDKLRLSGYAGSMHPIGNNQFAIGTRYQGVYLIDVNKRSITHIDHDPADPASIKSNFCRWIFVTKDRTLFAHTRGLSYASLSPPIFNSIKNLTNSEGEKYDAGFTSFISKNRNEIWIGTNSHLALWNRSTGVSEYFPFYDTAANQKTRTVRAVIADKLGRIWVGSFGGGIGMLQKSGRFEVYRRNVKDPSNSLAGNEIHSIAYDRDSNFILCGNLGFTLFDPVQKKAKSFFDHPLLQSISRHNTYSAYADKNGNWWLGQNSGLYVYNHDKQILQKIDEVKGTVQSIISDSSGNIYAGSTTGLYVFTKGSLNVKKRLQSQDGLASDNIMSMVCDQQNNIWILGNVGVARFTPHSGELQAFDARDGTEQSNHTLGNAYVSPEGEVFIGSSEGFNYFFPDKIIVNKKPLSVYIKSVEINDSILNIPASTTFDLSYNQNSITFSYTAVDYKLGPSIQYRYKLNGYDTAFRFVGKERAARYTNLPAGTYKFLLEASANGKDWYAADQQLSFSIARPFWRTWWFRLLLIGTGLMIIYLFYRNRIAQINKEARLRSDYEIKLNELENSALRTQMNPHFIFNSLNTINSFINSNDRVQANQYISKFSKLVRLILDHSREKRIVLKDELEVAELYIQLEQIRFDNIFSYAIEVADVDSSLVEVPPLIIQPFVENAILHGLLPKVGPGLLSISIQHEAGLLKCSIEDNGIGRTGAKKMKEKSGFSHKSHGMEITMKRIEFFNKENNVNERVEITDLLSSDNSPAGTRVDIRVAYVETF